MASGNSLQWHGIKKANQTRKESSSPASRWIGRDLVQSSISTGWITRLTSSSRRSPRDGRVKPMRPGSGTVFSAVPFHLVHGQEDHDTDGQSPAERLLSYLMRSEERRVGKERRSRW